MANDPFSDEAADDFLSGGGVAAKWPKVGHVVEGTITGWSMQQQNDFESGEPLYWVGNARVAESKATNTTKPVMQMILEILGEPVGKTWQRIQNEEVPLPDDDGARTLYVKAGLQAALKTALKEAKGKLEVGAAIKVTRIKDGPKSNPKYAAPHRYTAVWTPAAQNPKALAAQGVDEENPLG